MEKKKVPGYYGFRMYLSANMLHFFLVIPFSIFIFGQKIPELTERKGFLKNDTTMVADSLHATGEPQVAPTAMAIDSLVQTITAAGEEKADSITRAFHSRFVVETSEEKAENNLFDKEGVINKFFLWMFYLTLASYLVGFIYNFPFKRLFRMRQRGIEIPDKLEAFCKKQLLHSPLVNAGIVILPSILAIGYFFIFFILDKQGNDDLQMEAFQEFFYLTLIATLLEFLFVFYWQKHRVRLGYIEQVYSQEELRTNVYRRKGGRIKSRLIMASGMTTFLPLLVVMSYLLQSLTRIKDLGMEEVSPEAWKILIGPWGSMIGEISSLGTYSLADVSWMVYVNTADTLSMFAGISTGIIVSLIYLLLFIRWTNRDITQPVMEILSNMRSTRGGETEQYTIVRTNDEIGELAVGYNEMTHKIHDHVTHISNMNRDLEKTVKERTQEVVMQKEEIEAQKEEIEAQLDMATHQRDTITRQKDQILDSIRYAERIQAAILPPAATLAEFLSDHFILHKPRDIVSGDYYWTSYRRDKILIAVADCTGHGVPGAFLSALGISSMNEIVNRKGMVHASQILEQLRDFMIHSLHQTGTRGETQDGIEIAFCMIDPAKMTLEYAGANRPLYLVRPSREASDKPPYELIQIRGDRMPIGIYEQEASPFTNHKLRLQKGDSIYLFSDGYVDQLGGPRRKTYRSVHFRELLLQIQEKPMKEQKKILLEKHDNWRGKIEQIDDILVVGFRL